MPPRYAYWTIILEGKPTAFRAHTQDELLPTLKQLQARHPDAAMFWFARGRLWQSPEEERAAAEARRQTRQQRGPGWRPGGEHQDPRDRFKVPRDEKRRRFADKLRRERKEGAAGSGGEPPRGPGRPDRPRTGRPDRPRSESPAGWRPRGPGPGARGDRKPGGAGRGRPGSGGRSSGGGGRGRGGGGGTGRGGGGGTGGGGRGGGGRGGRGGPR